MYWFIWTTFRYYYENDITPDGKLVLWAKKIAKHFLERHNFDFEQTNFCNSLRNILYEYIEVDPMEDITHEKDTNHPFLEVKPRKQKKKAASNLSIKGLIEKPFVPMENNTDNTPTEKESGTKRNQEVMNKTTTADTPLQTKNSTALLQQLRSLSLNLPIKSRSSFKSHHHPKLLTPPKLRKMNTPSTLNVTINLTPPSTKRCQLDQEMTCFYYGMTDLLHNVFQHDFGDIQLLSFSPAGSKQNDPTQLPIQMRNLTPESLPYFSPRIVDATSIKMFFIYIRITTSIGSPYKWLSDPSTKAVQQEENINIAVSNSGTDTGNVIPIGYILLKHPTHAHLQRFLGSLRNSLPSITPFFDIVLHKRTPTGKEIPHLVVKCDENFAPALTDILTDHLNGSLPGVFIGINILRQQHPEATDTCFENHARHVSNLRRINLSPHEYNLDKLNTEIDNHGNTIVRTARKWAQSLANSDGHYIQTDVVNGAYDGRAFVLVPSENVELATTYTTQFKNSITKMVPKTNPLFKGRPNTIYIPTDTAKHNLTFLSNLYESSQLTSCNRKEAYQSHDNQHKR